jgi:5-formyltetrahydrofolate cyclo-ligase
MDKKAFRQYALKNLRAIPRQQARYMDYRVNRLLLDRIKQQGARSVMLYIPLDIEVDVMPLIGTLRRRGIEVLVPFMEGESFRLVQYRLPLRTKRFGVREPIFSRKYRKKRIDIAVVPIVGTDPTLRRVGFGKGMYDRFFTREGYRIADVIFVQRTEQYTPCVITDAWDVQADEILTGRIR